jgi:hypothetical protein
MRLIKSLIIMIFIASLSVTTSFALTAAECQNLLKSNNPNSPDVTKLKNLTPQQIVECGSSSFSKSQTLSPLSIFQIIINAVAALTFGLAIIATLVAVIKIATSIGDKAKFQEGLTLLKNAGIAFVLILTSYTIFTALINTFGFTLP